MRNLFLGAVGILLALWMGASCWAFGIGYELTRWYLPLIGVPFGILQLLVLRRVAVAEGRGRRVGRAVWVSLVLSWLCAISFGLTVPERSADGELLSLLGSAAGPLWNELSIALCNPFGIIAFATAVAALIFAIAAGRDPRPSEDELLDAAEEEQGMVPHPLGRSGR